MCEGKKKVFKNEEEKIPLARFCFVFTIDAGAPEAVVLF